MFKTNFHVRNGKKFTDATEHPNNLSIKRDKYDIEVLFEVDVYELDELEKWGKI